MPYIAESRPGIPLDCAIDYANPCWDIRDVANFRGITDRRQLLPLRDGGEYAYPCRDIRDVANMRGVIDRRQPPTSRDSDECYCCCVLRMLLWCAGAAAVLLPTVNAAFLLLLHTYFIQDCRGYRDFPSNFLMLKDVNVFVFTLPGLDYFVAMLLIESFRIPC